MSTTFYDLMRYAKTGIASPEMTNYDKLKALAIGGSKEQTLTGIPPLSFKSDGTPLISWSMKGNGSQTGTPDPTTPIWPQETGERTGNLWNEDYTGISGNLTYAPVYVGDGSFTLSTSCPAVDSAAALFFLAGNVQSGASTASNGVYKNRPITVASIDGYITIAYRYVNTAGGSAYPQNEKTMLNSGSTALPYEPFGYKVALTANSTTTPVYLGQTQTTRRIKKLVLTGEESISTASNDAFRFQVSGYMRRLGEIIGISTHYAVVACKDSISQWTANDELTFLVSPSGNNYMYIRDTAYNSSSTAFRQFLAAQYAAGTPVTVWYVLATPETGIVNEPLAKIRDYADELHSEDASVTIPTIKGQNTLTVDTPIQPSEMTIQYRK